MNFIRVVICDLGYAVRHFPDLAFKVGFELEMAKLALVKPNICGFYHPSLDLLVSVFDFLLKGCESVFVGESWSGIHNPLKQFEKLGINRVLERFEGRVRAIDLSEDDHILVNVPRPHVLDEIEFSKMVLDAGILVNVPKVGTHPSTRITCALKNLFGLLSEKRKHSVFHPLGVDKVVADIAQVVKPDLNVVDTGEKVVFGVDALAVDVVSCRFLDLNPLVVEHLKLVSEDRGEKLEDFMERIKVIEI